MEGRAQAGIQQTFVISMRFVIVGHGNVNLKRKLIPPAMWAG